ncbi:MAG: hypothetical protein ACUVV6_08440 [Thermoplasmatota archaeon]
MGALAVTAVVLLAGMPAAGDVYDMSKTVDLIAGKNLKVGTVTVTHDADYLYVTCKITEPEWYLSETHVGISVEASCPGDQDPSGIPAKNGNPQPGKFPYKTTHDPVVTEYKYKIPMPSDFDAGEYICFATHAVVVKMESNVITQSQTAWGDGHDFSGRNWAMYFCYHPAKTLDLPDSVSADISHNGGRYDCDGWESYWRVVVKSGGSGDLPNSETGTYYVGWCVDRTTTISGKSHTFAVIPWYDTEGLPDDEDDENQWNEINYVLNNKDSYTATEIQNAIWYFTGDLSTNDLTENEKALVEGAEANGASFCPGPGEWMAVLLQEGSAQSIIIEVDP